MAAPERLSKLALIEQLAREGNRLGFFQVVARVEALMPGAVPIGEGGPASEEGLRLRHDPRPIFHASDVLSVVPRDPHRGRARTVVTTTFLGLLGSVSPLPMYMTEDVLAADASDETSLHSFYDLFHHRVLSLLYRTWRKHRFHVGATSTGADAPTRRLLSFVGIDPGGGKPEEQVPPWLLVGLAPLVSMRSRSARTLRLALDMLLPGIPVDVDCFALRRVPLSDNQRVALGVRNTILGNDLTIGRTVADRSGRFRVRIGPVDYERFEGLAPGGPMHAELAATINHFSGGVLEAEVELSLAADEAPQFQLGSQRGGILGRTTRLATKATEPIRSRFVLGERVGAQQLGDAGPPSRVPV